MVGNEHNLSSLYLVDASIYIFRAWFSLPSQMLGSNGSPVNAAYGFTKFLTELLERSKPSHIVIAFDESLTHSFRNEIYPPYKMNRELPPQELKQQFSLCRRIAESAGIQCVAHDRYEADDLIGTLANAAKHRDQRVVIVSADKDLAQLIGDDDQFWDFAANKLLSSELVQEKFGVTSQQMTDYLGLCGDAVDNIPGVPGVGPKTAVALLQSFADMETLYADLAKVATLDIRGAKKLPEKLALYKEQAYLSKTLATIALDAPIDCSLEFTQRNPVDVHALQLITEELGRRGAGLFERMIQNTAAPMQTTACN